MRLRLTFLILAASLVVGGCVGPSADPTIEDDLVAFANGIDAILVPGMTIREARRALLTRFPAPAENSASAPLVIHSGQPGQNKRYIMIWETFTPGTRLMLTMECDRVGRIARWVTGPLYSRQEAR